MKDVFTEAEYSKRLNGLAWIWMILFILSMSLATCLWVHDSPTSSFHRCRFNGSELSITRYPTGCYVTFYRSCPINKPSLISKPYLVGYYTGVDGRRHWRYEKGN